jgi:hypothetical protein
MSDTGKQRPPDAPLRGEAAWRAAKDAIADRNEKASKRAREQRRQDDDAQIARRRAAERLENAKLVNRPRP